MNKSRIIKILNSMKTEENIKKAIDIFERKNLKK